MSNDISPGAPSTGDEGVSHSQPVPAAPPAEEFVYIPRKRFQHVWWKHILLFLLTVVTTTYVAGPWYSAAILAILGAHEMGHYLACRYYNIDATLPYFLPLILPAGPQSGTLGAVIRIREPFPDRRVLFDVGIAGPIAGFVVLVPLLFLGLSWSTVIEKVPSAVQFGRPLLYQLARWLTFGSIPETHLVLWHPIVFASWIGMLATALNLLPFGQLDGGHITYSALGRVSTSISLVTVACAIVMTFFSLNWLLMTVLMVAMLVLAGPRHPPVIDESEKLGTGRLVLTVFALAILILCFTPFPLRFTMP